MLKIIKLTLAIFVVLFLKSCKKDCPPCQDPTNPKCENYDPCYGKKSANFGFTFGSQWGTEESLLGIKNYVHNKDSVFVNKERLNFTAHSIYDSVIWKLGSETIVSKSFVRIFSNVPEGYYQCQMIGFRAKQSCIKNDDGIDTVLKRWYMIPIPKLSIIGKFKVLFTGSKDSSIIEVLPWHTYKYYVGIYPNGYFKIDIKEKDTNSGHITLVNFLNNRDTTSSHDLIGYKPIFSGNWIVFNDNGFDDVPLNGYFNVQGDKVYAKYFTEKFKVFTTELIVTQYEFKGRKLK